MPRVLTSTVAYRISLKMPQNVAELLSRIREDRTELKARMHRAHEVAFQAEERCDMLLEDSRRILHEAQPRVEKWKRKAEKGVVVRKREVEEDAVGATTGRAVAVRVKAEAQPQEIKPKKTWLVWLNRGDNRKTWNKRRREKRREICAALEAG